MNNIFKTLNFNDKDITLKTTKGRSHKRLRLCFESNFTKSFYLQMIAYEKLTFVQWISFVLVMRHVELN